MAVLLLRARGRIRCRGGVGVDTDQIVSLLTLAAFLAGMLLLRRVGTRRKTEMLQAAYQEGAKAAAVASASGNVVNVGVPGDGGGVTGFSVGRVVAGVRASGVFDASSGVVGELRICEACGQIEGGDDGPDVVPVVSGDRVRGLPRGDASLTEWRDAP